MELRANNVTEILSNFLKATLIETPLGKGVEVEAREAFLFSTLANGYYFDSSIAPYKFFLRACNSALNFNLVNGLFDGHVLSGTPHLECKKRDYLREPKKTIVPIEINGPNSLRSKLESRYGPSNSDPNIVLLMVDLTKKGHGLEPFLEYLVSKYFSAEGFITETQIPLSHSQGNPDFGCYSLPFIQNLMIENKLLFRGFNVLEIAMLRDFKMESFSPSSSKVQTNFLVGDAKTSTTLMKKQIEKYLDTGYFNHAVECHPDKSLPSVESWGIFNVLNNLHSYKEPKKENDYSNKKSQRNYINWLNSYLNLFLIANYDNDELNRISNDFINKDVSSRQDIIKLITEFDFKTHLDKLRKVIGDI